MKLHLMQDSTTSSPSWRVLLRDYPTQLQFSFQGLKRHFQSLLPQSQYNRATWAPPLHVYPHRNPWSVLRVLKKKLWETTKVKHSTNWALWSVIYSLYLSAVGVVGWMIQNIIVRTQDTSRIRANSIIRKSHKATVPECQCIDVPVLERTLIYSNHPVLLS